MESGFTFLETNDLDGFRRTFSTENINARSKDGYTPLYFCCMKKSIELIMISEVLKLGAEVDGKGLDDETPLFIASFHNRVDVVKLLLSSGADINGINGIRRETALHVAARLEYEDLLVLLLKNGANLNIRNHLLETPAYCAAKCGKHRTLYHLICFGVNLKLTNEDGKDPLFIASERNHRSAVILLKASKDELKHAKAAADAEASSMQKVIHSSEEIVTRMAKDVELQQQMQGQKMQIKEDPKLTADYHTEIIDIYIPKPKVRLSNTFSGGEYGPCKTLEEVGYDKPLEIPSSLQNLPLSKPRRMGSTLMMVETDKGPVSPIRVDELMGDRDISYYVPPKFAY